MIIFAGVLDLRTVIESKGMKIKLIDVDRDGLVDVSLVSKRKLTTVTTSKLV